MGEEAVCLAVLTDGSEMENEKPSVSESRCCHKRLVDDSESEPSPNKKPAKETSNEDLCSEVVNPNLSPRENASSFQTITSQSVELACSNQVGCVENASTCSDDSSTKISSSEEEGRRNDNSGTVFTSHVVLEVPKHESLSGIRKITFKFSKRKEDYDGELSGLVSQHGRSLTLNKINSDVDLGPYGKGFPENANLVLSAPNMELKMSKKIVTDSYLNNAKKLLSTGIFEGARVKYISSTGEKELIGIVKNGGYLCGCPSCNFYNVISAYEFEMHAGCRSRHPNKHIYLDCGKSIYSVIQHLQSTPFNLLDEAVRSVAGSSVNEEYLQHWKARLLQADGIVDADKRFYVKQTSRHHPVVRPTFSSTNSTVQQKRTADGGTKKRDNDLHRLLFMPNGLPDGAELAYYSKGQKILKGYKQGNGIVCNHCDCEISPSQFEAHAGWATRRQPYRHIYTSSGLTLHDIAISLANGQHLSTGDSDDMCTVCGDGGDLVLCDGCPRAFHAACLQLQRTPEGDWHCPTCREKLAFGRKATSGDASRPIIIRLTRVVKAPEAEVGGCVVCRAHDFSVAKFDDRTVMLCDQCEREFHVGCLRDSGLCNLKELPKDKWFCCEDCNRIHVALQNQVLAGANMIPDLGLNTINRKLLEKGLSNAASSDIQWRILSGKSRFPEHLPLLSRATAIFRECFDPIVATSGRDLIPVMVYGRNISGQEFGGMYCVVFIVNSVVVSAGLLRVFGREVAELPIVATSREYQGKGYFQALFSCVERLLCSLNVKNLVLPAAEEAESIWTNKFGFKKMGEERLLKYSKEIQLTSFKGTSMLEKEVQMITE